MKKLLKLSFTLSAVFATLLLASCKNPSNPEENTLPPPRAVQNPSDAMNAFKDLEGDITSSLQLVIKDLATPTNPFYTDVFSKVINPNYNPKVPSSFPIQNPIQINVSNKQYKAKGTVIDAIKLNTDINVTPASPDIHVEVKSFDIDEKITFDGSQLPLPLETDTNKTRPNKIKDANISLITTDTLDAILVAKSQNEISIKQINSGDINLNLTAKAKFDTTTYNGYFLVSMVLNAKDIKAIQDTINTAPSYIQNTIKKIQTYSKAQKENPKPSVMPEKPTEKELKDLYTWIDANIDASVDINFTFTDINDKNPYEFLKITKLSELANIILLNL